MRSAASPGICGRAAAAALVSPATLGALGVMVLNDHVLKGWLPGALTGKLSDFAFLFFAPIVVAFVARARARSGIVLCFAIPTALFVGINVSHACSDAFAGIMSRIVPMQLWPDPTDLIALSILPLSYWHLTRPRPRLQIRRSIEVGVTALATLACVATSPPRPPRTPTHHPVYMSWEELRTSAVQVLPPRPIERRGKLLIAEGHLFVSEPGQGVHVFDNRIPTDPVPILFVRIPGNIDIAVRDGRLYADSFVDLLTFELDLPARRIELVERLEDQFRYDPYQSLGADERIVPPPVDPSHGVVVAYVPITEEGARSKP
jgi:hypothetical protein